MDASEFERHLVSPEAAGLLRAVLTRDVDQRSRLGEKDNGDGLVSIIERLMA
jgi:hypothetical protein